jgi:hypothetical protein
MRSFIAFAAALLLGVAPNWCTSYYLSTDVPSLLGGTNYTTNQIMRSDDAVYVLQASLPAGTEIASLHRRADGSYLFSPAQPVTLGATDFQPRDLVSYDGTAFAMFLDGSAEGIPAGARIDALFVDPVTGNPVLSFDTPVTFGVETFSPSDLVSRTGAGAFALFWDADAAGVPAYANVVGADVNAAGDPVVSFDVPTNLGGTEFLPGQLVRWDGVAFGSFLVDPAWPPSAQLRDFSFVPSAPAGRVADDGCLPAAVALTVTRDPVTGDLTLTWDASCLADDSDYEIYESAMMGPTGAQGFYSHASRFCTSGGSLSLMFAPLSVSAPAIGNYYLVVPRNAVREGSYGRDSNCVERPPGDGSCEAQEIAPCP